LPPQQDRRLLPSLGEKLTATERAALATGEALALVSLLLYENEDDQSFEVLFDTKRNSRIAMEDKKLYRKL